jgi:hypothetical protein
MGKVYEKTKEEFLALLPPTIFFFITLGLVALISTLMRKGTTISGYTLVQVVVGALVLGKSVLLADLLPGVNRYPDKPLAYNVIWKTLIYFLVATAIHYLEHLIDFWKGADGFIAANRLLFDHIIWPHFWAIQIILLMLISDYCVIHELGRVMGRRKLLELFFGRRQAPLEPVAPVAKIP